MVKKILTIDGGGMYGVVPLEVCLRIEEKLGKPLREIFDLFAGKSTGSLISAAALMGLHHEDGTSTSGFSAHEIIKAYEEERQAIFRTREGNINVPGTDILAKPRYAAEGLDESLNRIIGARTLGRLNDMTKKHISISAYNMSKGKPHFFRSWVDKNIDLKDAVMASSSAPTYHPMHKVGSDFYTDGGVFAVNPAPYALADGLKLWPNESLVIVSLGTGKYEPSLEPPNNPDEGTVWWLKNISKVFTDGQNESAHETMVQISQKVNKTPINEKTPWLTYFRFDVDLNQNKKADELDFNVLNEARKLMGQELDGRQKNEFDRMIESLELDRAIALV